MIEPGNIYRLGTKTNGNVSYVAGIVRATDIPLADALIAWFEWPNPPSGEAIGGGLNEYVDDMAKWYGAPPEAIKRHMAEHTISRDSYFLGLDIRHVSRMHVAETCSYARFLVKDEIWVCSLKNTKKACFELVR